MVTLSGPYPPPPIPATSGLGDHGRYCLVMLIGGCLVFKGMNVNLLVGWCMEPTYCVVMDGELLCIILYN